MNCLSQIQPLSSAEATLVVGIYRFARHRSQYGELLTEHAVDKITALARIIGIRAERLPSKLGPRPRDVWWNTALLRHAAGIVEREQSWGLVLRLETLLQDLSVSDVEGYEGPEDTQAIGPAAPEDTDVFTVNCLDEEG